MKLLFAAVRRGLARITVSATMRYDAEGRLAKSVISDVTTYRISALMDRTNGSDTSYYWFTGRRIAVRDSSGLSLLYADNLGSTMVTTGTVNSTEPYTL